jgi:hypothetical protein
VEAKTIDRAARLREAFGGLWNNVSLSRWEGVVTRRSWALRLVLPAGAGLAAATNLLPGVGAATPANGPELAVAPADLEASLACPHRIEGSHRDVIILVTGTAVHPRTNFGMSWIRAFEALGYPYCYVVTPHAGMDDIQVSSEHVVYAIREVRRRSGRKVDVLGVSQGGTSPRWGLRWWPDTRALVDDYTGIAPSSHGGKAFKTMFCGDGDCAPSSWQQSYGSNFVRAMNSGGETFLGIDYTVAWTAYEEFLTPPESSMIAGATNIKVQDICPANTSEHLAIGTYDPVAYAVSMDALDHDGPADPARIDHAVCAQAATYPQVKEEPPFMPYARG